MTEKKKTAKKRRVPQRLSETLYCYVEPVNAKHAKTVGKKAFGSFSKYVDRLITLHRTKHIGVAMPRKAEAKSA